MFKYLHKVNLRLWTGLFFLCFPADINELQLYMSLRALCMFSVCFRGCAKVTRHVFRWISDPQSMIYWHPRLWWGKKSQTDQCSVQIWSGLPSMRLKSTTFWSCRTFHHLRPLVPDDRLLMAGSTRYMAGDTQGCRPVRHWTHTLTQ